MEVTLVRRICTLTILSLLVLLGSGCAAFNTYFFDRMNDLADVVKFDVGFGIGLDAHVSVTDLISTGVGYSDTYRFGLRGGRFGSWRDIHAGIPVATALVLFSSPSPGIFSRFSWDPFVTEFISIGDMSHSTASRFEPVVSESLLLFNTRLTRGSHRSGLFQETEWLEDPICMFDIEVSATVAIVGVRFGFSPGHLLDFLLGFLTIDIAGDDTYSELLPDK